MAHFELPQNKKKRLFTGPETKSPNKLLAVVGLLALFGLAGLLGSYYFQNKKPDDGAITVPSASPGTTTTEPVATPPPMPTGTYIDNRIRPKTELNSEILADVTDTYDKTSGHMPIEELSAVEEQPYLNVLNYLLSHTEKEIRSNLTIPHPELHPRVTYYDMMQRPKDVRGATVILQGKVRLYGYMEYDPEFQREAGIHGCWYGNLFDKHGNQFAFRVLKDGQKFKEADTLSMYAVFLKKIWMLNRRGQQRGMAEYSIMPFCVARTAEHFVYESESLFSGESIAFFVAFALLVIVFGLTLGREITRSLSRRFG